MRINQANHESAAAMTETSDPTLAQLGWRSFFSEQVSAEQSHCQPVRVMSVHRGRVTVSGEGVEDSISSSFPAGRGADDRPTVGDWLLIDRDTRSLVRILDRTSLFKRPAPGDERRVQLIAANVDTLFIVTSCDQDFNIARLERYLVLTREVGVRDGRPVEVAGIILVPQKPGSAKGVLFITIEDETGVANGILWPDRFGKQRRTVMSASMIGMKGCIQKEGEVIHVICDRIVDYGDLLAVWVRCRSLIIPGAVTVRAILVRPTAATRGGSRHPETVTGRRTWRGWTPRRLCASSRATHR